MAVDGKKPRHGQLNSEDRFSDLPDSILHLIISYLGTKEACRTTILSKRWAHIWSTGLILDFNPQLFGYNDWRFVNFIESTMQQYSEKNLSIKMFRLEYLSVDQEMTGRIDRWFGVALRNQVEALSLSLYPVYPPLYALPAILFFSKSLISLTCDRVRVPYFENVKLISLQVLDLTMADIDEHMLHDIIMSSPLKSLRLEQCFGLKNISIPCCSRLESLHVAETIPVGGRILVDTSSFQSFTYKGYGESWPVSLTPASKKNLKELCVFNLYIESDSFGKLVSELPSIEIIELFDCKMEKRIKIASQKLKELSIRNCDDLSWVMMEAPQLKTFCYNGDWRFASVINSHNNYNGYFHLTVSNLDTRAFLVIKYLLVKSNCSKVLSIILTDEPEIKFDKDKVGKFGQYPLSEAIDVQELKLSLSFLNCIPEKSSCRALIDGLLWCCRPAILSVSVTLQSDNFDNPVIKTFLEILQSKVENWKHPLKRMEIEGTNCSSFLSFGNLEVRLRLHW